MKDNADKELFALLNTDKGYTLFCSQKWKLIAERVIDDLSKTIGVEFCYTIGESDINLDHGFCIKIEARDVLSPLGLILIGVVGTDKIKNNNRVLIRSTLFLKTADHYFSTNNEKLYAELHYSSAEGEAGWLFSGWIIDEYGEF